MIFQDRYDAGRRLADALDKYRDEPVIVLALPRGGVIVGYEVANALHAPLNVIISRKIGAPGDPEFAIGAISENGEMAVNDEILSMYRIPQSYVTSEARRQMDEIKRRINLYRNGRPLPDLKDKTVILVDDGMATGSTMMAAAKAVQAEKARKVVVAIPVAPPETVETFKKLVDEVVCLSSPEYFMGVGRWYVNFEQVSDEKVKEILGT